MSAPRNTGHRSRSSGAWLGLAALLCLPLLEAAHPFLYYANHARRGYGRNIQPLPCATKEGDTGVCMFAWDCMKAEGTHLGTCIERFYFGSCCKLKPGSKKPEHTVMKTDVYVLATTSQPQTGATDALSPSTQQAGSTLLGMITGQTTLTSESFDTSTLRTTLLTSGVEEESFSGVQEVQQVFGLGAQETEAQSTSSADLDMEAIEQQMVEESDAQEVKEENNEIQTDSDSLPENGDKSHVNEEGTQVPGDKTTGGQTPEVPESEQTTVELSLNETTQHQTDAPIQSTVEESLSATEESQVSSDQSEDKSDKNEETNEEEIDGTPINQEQNEIDAEQESAVVDEVSSGQDQSLQFLDTDQNSIDITPEILSQVLEIENGLSQDSESQVIGVGIGTVTSVEIDYVSSATEPTVVQSENLPGEAVLENAIHSEHAEDENSDSTIVTSVIQETTQSQTSGPDSTRESSSSENEVEGVENPTESSTAADSSTSTTSAEEQAGLSEVTESSNQATDTEESETAPTTEIVSLTTGENDASVISSEQTESETTTGEQTSETETTVAAATVTEKPSSPAEPDEMASQPLGSSDISSEVSDDGSQTTVAPQQIDSTVLPELSDPESPSDSVPIGGQDISSGIENGQSTPIEGLATDSAIKSSSDEASATTGEGENAQSVSDDDDALAAVTEATSDEASSSSGGDAGNADLESSDVASPGDESDVASDSESEAQATSDVGDGNDVSASTADSGASTATTDSSDMQTPDSDISQSVSSTEQAIETDENAPEENDETNAENAATDTPTDSLEQDISTSLPPLDENVIVPGVQIVPAPGSVKNESSTGSSPPEENVGVDISSGGSADSTTEIPLEYISTEAPSTGSSSGEASSTDKSPAEDTVDPLSSSDEVSVPEEPEAVVDGTSAAHLNETAQSEQHFETQEEQLLHRLKTSPFKEICGQPVYPSRRIVGGSQASFGEWPWQVSLRQWRSVTYLHKCGAALVNENWAITAAHCVENVLPDQLLLRLGEFDLERADEPYGHVERKVQIIATHPQFDPRTFEYDLALLRFNEPVTFQPNIIPICIPEDDYDFIGDTGFVSGWGRLYEDGPLPSLMQKVPVPVITNGECEIMYRNAGYIEDIPNIFICAGYEGGKRDSCEGDSGGPLVIQYKNSWKLAGVISWGIGCALPNQPGVYTRISAFREWINKIIVF